ncbi:hypothetical protein [Acidilobus sp. 7A]|uniref:hypothetical protein n=1 Tax=Acidilobus sp. 7A TaxID=1577685 RepID=UPI0011E4D056|nr:hypothetical protein [Acidilobus sp. 7A]
MKYCDESWWQDFFTKDLAEFYASLEGLLSARDALINELSGDMAQVLADPQRRDLALRVLFGGLDEGCLEKIRHYHPTYEWVKGVGSIGISNVDITSCIRGGKAAHFYREVLGIGLAEQFDEDMKMRGGLLNQLKTMSFEEISKEKLGISIKGYDKTIIMNDLSEMRKIVGKIYNYLKKKQVIQVQHEQANYGLDLVKAFEDFLNKSIKLLPLYNPFTFFIQSLRSTPRPYLSIMYGEELFSDPVRNLMSKYGVELTKILDPGLYVQSKNDELAIIGHKDGSVGKLIDELVQKIYDIISKLNSYGYLVSDEDEYKKYVKAKYNEEISAGYTLEKLMTEADFDYKKYCQGRDIAVERGVVKTYEQVFERGEFKIRDETTIGYERFLELFSPLLFLGIAWIEGGELHVACLGG